MTIIEQCKVLLRYRDTYLLLKKSRDIHADHRTAWEVPGGKRKPGEDARAAALRELSEETGIDTVRIVAELAPLSLENEGIKTRTRVYLAESDTNKVILSSEHAAYRWMRPEDVDRLKKVIYRDLLKRHLREAENIKEK